MRYVRLFGVLILFLFSACILEPDKGGGNNPPISSSIMGFVTMEQLSGAEDANDVYAMFAKEVRPQLDVRMSLASLAPFRLNTLDYLVPRAANCKIANEPKTGVSKDWKLISVGKLEVGPAFQSSLVAVPEDKDHRYQLSFAQPLPAGNYQVRAAGGTEISAFSGVLLSMPEPLEEPKANDVLFGKDPLTVKKKNALVLRWRRPLMPNEANIMVFVLKVLGMTQKTTLTCVALEKEFYNAKVADLEWVIPVATLEQIPSSNTAQISFLRAHINSIQGKVRVDFEGVRRYSSLATVEF